MVSRKRISYKWRLFVPTIVTMWLVIIGMSVWQTRRDSEFRRNLVQSHLNLVNSHMLDAIENGRTDLGYEFLQFIDRFYYEDKMFTAIRVTIYNRNWDVIRAVGTPILLTPDQRAEALRGMVVSKGRTGDLTYFYMAATSNNGETHIVSALPNDSSLQDFMEGDREEVWVIVLCLAVVMTIVIYYSSQFLSKNIYLLQQFSRRISNDPDFVPGTDFPHDELGDVAREIATIYNERAQARQRLDHEHNVAMRAIQEKALQKRQLTNNINHELKTPIGVIKGYLDTLVENPDLDAETTAHFIRKSRDHANRLAELVADVSAITRLDDGSNMISTETIDYHDIVYTFESDINESGAIGKMKFSYNVPVGTYIKGNSNLLTAMLMNLAKNSANYSQGSKCCLECNGTTEDGRFYSFSFYDDGIGVPDDSLEYLFDRFYRIDSGRTRKAGGTGLGLTIVHNTITALGGQIKGLNREGMGLEIRFTLPKAKAL